jgi:hypothetical protein
MNLKAIVIRYLAKARSEASLRDEIGKYLAGPWLDDLTAALEHEAKRWWWVGMGIGLAIGLVVGGVVGALIANV